MKSVFGKGRTVFDAIQKAWKAAGKPENFTVKIIDVGKKSWFGLFSSRSVVSISYKQSKPIRSALHQKEVRKPLSYKKEVSREKKDRRVSQRKVQIDSWSQELLSEISDYLKQSLSLMNIKPDFEININKKILNISFKENILQLKDEEKIFFISLSHLFMQMLKKKHRRRFDGFHIIINSPLTVNNANK